MEQCPQDGIAKHIEKEYLADLVERVCSTYDDQKGINHIEGFNLPNQAEILNILHELLEIIFPGFSGKKNYSMSTVRYAIGEILGRIYSDLYDQIARCLRYNCETHVCENCNIPEMSENATKNLLDHIPEIREIMKDDVTAAYDGDPAARSIDEIILSYPGIKAITIQRLAHILYCQKIPLMPRLMSEYAHSETGIDIHPGAQLGRSIFIDHGTGVVIGETAVIGNGVKIYQGVTLGALSFPKDSCGMIIKGRKRHPTISDNVTIYAGATILGDIVIGEGSVIGGNVWLTESTKPGTKIIIAPPEHKVKTPK